MLFAAAAARARELNAGAIMIYAEIYAEPSAVRRPGATRIGEGPYLLSPEIVLPHFLYIVSQAATRTIASGPIARICSRATTKIPESRGFPVCGHSAT